MEISYPTWNAEPQSYSFRIMKSDFSLDSSSYFDKSTNQVNLPDIPSSINQSFLKEFLEKSKKYFTNPLTPEKVLRHLRHGSFVQASSLPSESKGYTFSWRPYTFTLKAGDYVLTWEPYSFKETEAIIPASFTEATTPRAQSPIPEQMQELRNIQIHDSLIPVGDLPLSDLPPLSFGTDQVDPVQEEIKRRIREARLKVQLAKLKAQRMEHKYFERYGQQVEESEDSSDFSSDSDEEEEIPFERHSNA